MQFTPTKESEMKKTVAEHCSVQGDLTVVGYNTGVVYTPVEGEYLGRQLYPTFRTFDTFDERRRFITANGCMVRRTELGETLCLMEYEEEYDLNEEVETKEEKYFERMELKMIRKQKIPSAWLSRHVRDEFGIDCTVTLDELMRRAR